MKSAISNLCVDNFIQCSRCEFKFFCGGDCRGSAYENSNKNLYAPIPYCKQRKDSILELFRIISEDPNFFDKKANFFISNAINETEKRVKSDQT
jgi:sulfatase maturation enzyme AslB (radical SAM superfamily)